MLHVEFEETETDAYTHYLGFADEEDTFLKKLGDSWTAQQVRHFLEKLLENKAQHL